MTASGVSQLVYLFDEAFQGTDWHSLLGNLHSVTPEDWLWVPPGGQRSIRDIVGHVGGCKFMYHNHAFGDAQLNWDDPLVEGCGALSTLSDAELLRPRMTNWGELKETRWIIAVMIQHDLLTPRHSVILVLTKDSLSVF